ncbi:uncharacterized protein LY89DRAFT_734772 [Mollisia scopiformis]|uniref:N-acetyltransferase domain-containing protein n=1 Tax=Mollisia scopiformis TaxID=149040 RepID=A0A194X6B8_MOLSC|nr:uncharacterized protein LY89DRAFT_734772 [Mollisia scopiformis]KUJ15614.1 hypothetical protein LY89DRAFT_734772 [Mollisia scopiformis]
MAVPIGFRLEKASPEDMKDVFALMMDAYVDDEVWQTTVKDCDQKEILPWTLKTFTPRWTMPDIETYKIIEEKSGRLAAWASFQTPWKYVSAMTPELKTIAQSKEVPPALPGTNMEAFQSLFEMLNGAYKYGYNPEEDYHRKGTTVHPDFQKKGLGTALTVFWNDIADKTTGDKTWCPCRPTSIKMFRDHGFQDVGEIDSQLERWGGSRANSITYITVRHGPGSEAEASGTAVA